MSSSFTKRPGFVREQTQSIDDTVFLDSDNNSIAKVSEAELPFDDLTKTQKQSLTREIEVKETLEDIQTELRRIAFLLERISGVDAPREVFLNDPDY